MTDQPRSENKNRVSARLIEQVQGNGQGKGMKVGTNQRVKRSSRLPARVQNLLLRTKYV